jgi:hypothetical protein
VRSNILDDEPAAKLAVYAVWMPMLGGEERSDFDGGPLVEQRVAHFWDQDKVLGRWLADHETGDLGREGGIVWDAYLLFGPDARWEDEAPEPLAAGATIIGETDELEREAAALVD